ncbi:MAG: DNA polymerase IV [Eubacterium sp.]|nr:DNA polymerase IV [Eubacterium sp.]
MDRVILHCDMNSFYASVELLDHPELRDVPVAVSGSADSRHGIILAKNMPAKKFGVKTAETIWQAKRKCPGLVLLPAHHEKYKEYNRKINRIFLDYTDMVEPFSIDESWLDVTGSIRLFGSGRRIADTIRDRVRNELGITLSAGVSFNKIFAKMGSEYRKPDATTEITRENYKEILWPMPVSELFFCGWATAQKLVGMGISTIGDLAQADPALLEKALGKQGPMLRTYARGEDDSPVRLYDQKEKIKSVGNGLTFSHDLTSDDDILTALTSLSDTVAGRLRKYQMKAYGIKVDIKDTSLRVVSRQKQLAKATNLADEIREHARGIVQEAWPAGKPIRMLTVTGINLADEDEDEQLSLFSGSVGAEQLSLSSDASSSSDKSESVERTMDEIRKKFGSSSIKFGRVIGSDIGVDL